MREPVTRTSSGCCPVCGAGCAFATWKPIACIASAAATALASFFGSRETRLLDARALTRLLVVVIWRPPDWLIVMAAITCECAQTTRPSWILSAGPALFASQVLIAAYAPRAPLGSVRRSRERRTEPSGARGAYAAMNTG